MAALGTPTLAQEDRGVGERFTATAINMGARRTTVDRVEIVVNQWSPRVQRDRLMGVLFEKGPDTLLDVLKDLAEGRLLPHTREPGL